MNQIILTLLLISGVEVQSFKPKGGRNRPLNNGRRKLIDQEDDDRALWFTGNYDAPLVDVKIVPPPRKGCSLKSGPGTTCAPSRTPSAMPSRPPTDMPTGFPSRSHSPTVLPSSSPTLDPSSSPSYRPSRFPTKSPTAIPSMLPTLSQVPSKSNYPSTVPTTSVAPTNIPSKSPSHHPSAIPSKSPSQVPSRSPSTFPSASPSKKPSQEPSALPSNFPTHPPTLPPSRNPTTSPSNVPSLSPSNSPSRFPSTSPSNKPSRAPSDVPSTSPSKSAAPTVLLFNTKPTTDTNGNHGENSTCLHGPPSGSPTPQSQVLTYNYNIYLAQGSSTNNQTGPVELRLQKALSYYYLKCQFHHRRLQGTGFYVVDVSSFPVDVISSTGCSSNQTVTGATCYVVNGGVTIGLLYANAKTATNILGSFGAFLASEMDSGRLNGGDVVGLHFLGFTNVGTSGTSPDTTAAAAQQGGTTSSNRNVGVIAGSAAVACAVLILVVVLFVALRRKRGDHREVYLKQDEDLRDLDGDEETYLAPDMNMKSILVDEDENSFSSSLKGIKLEKKDVVESVEKYGVHKCSSATCEICQNAKQPTFVSTDWRVIQAELGPRIYHPKSRRYVAEDTVDL